MNDERRDGTPTGAGGRPLPEPLDRAARRYHEPPGAPLERMWARIAEARHGRVPAAPRPWWRRRRVWWPVAAAAVLTIGFLFGRISVQPSPDAPLASHETTGDQTVALARSSHSRTDAFLATAVPTFRRAEALLVQYRTGTAMPENPTFSDRASGLLVETRLLLDSPAADHPTVERLLSDLELTLAQIVQIAATEPAVAELVHDGMDRRALLPRLRARIPTTENRSQL
jgi:hypothetical protein